MDHAKAPAEAATRENGAVEYPNPFDWKRPENIDGHPDRYNPLRDAIENILLTRLHQKRLEGHVLEVSMQIMDAVRLSTHQQQGKCFECGSDLQLPICPKCNPEFDLSRAPQPDTVTEEMVEAAWGEMPNDGSPGREHVRAALTAAIAARGKVG